MSDRVSACTCLRLLADAESDLSVWIGVDAGPPSIHVYDLELATETGTMPGSPSAPIGTPSLG